MTTQLTQYLRDIELPLGCRLVVISYSALGRTLLKHRIWERGTTLFLLRNLNPGHVFVNVGSNVGYYTCLAARRVGPKGLVIAFEPEPLSYKLLIFNVKLNRLSNVICESFALADLEGTGSLLINPAEPGSHSLIPKSSSEKTVKVKVISLDSYFSHKRYPLPDFVKIDVEGSEFKVLRGMRKIIEKARKLSIIVKLSFKEYTVHYLERLLNAYGLKPYVILNDGNIHTVKIETLKYLKGANILLSKE